MGWSPTLPVLLGFFDGNLGTWGEGRGDGTRVSSPQSFPGGLHAWPLCSVFSQPLLCTLGHLILVYPSEAIWQKCLAQSVGRGNEELVADSDERDC